MGNKTGIQWTDATWNPIVGCDIVSSGCKNCYAMKMAKRIEAMGNAPHYTGLTKTVNGKAVWTGKVVSAPDHIWETPLKRKKPTMYFVNSEGDLFHKKVPVDWSDRCFAIMALCPQHIFQPLTKRHKEMRDYCNDPEVGDRIRSLLNDQGPEWGLTDQQIVAACVRLFKWPLSNVWMGVSAEDQEHADERIPLLLDTLAAVRWVSYEPALGPIDFTAIPNPTFGGCKGNTLKVASPFAKSYAWPNRLNWVVVGGESGPKARMFVCAWARHVIKDCHAAGAAVFVKQLGAHAVDAGHWFKFKSPKGGEMSEWPEDLRVREWPEAA